MSLLAALLLHRSVEAAEGSGAFPPASLASWVEGDAPAVLVAGAGDASATVAADVRVALQASRASSLVMDASALGDVTTMADKDIVAAAAGLPVAQIWVVRSFPGDGGSTTVVTMYDPGGRVIGALTVAEGATLAPREEHTGGGLSTAASLAVAAIAAPVGSPANVERFEERAVWFQDVQGVNTQTGTVISWAVPHAGRYGDVLRGARFYDWVAQPDLAKQYRTRSTIRTTAQLVGYGTAVGGTVVAIGGAYSLLLLTSSSSCYGSCDDGGDPGGVPPAVVAGGVMIGSGLVVALVAQAVSPHPVVAEERRRLADEYNEALRAELGIDAGE